MGFRWDVWDLAGNSRGSDGPKSLLSMPRVLSVCFRIRPSDRILMHFSKMHFKNAKCTKVKFARSEMQLQKEFV